MNTIRIGLVAHNDIVSFQTLAQVARALQEQVYHLKQWWDVQSNVVVSAFPDINSPHPGVWPIVIANGINPDNGGYHITTAGTPVAFVQGPTQDGRGKWWTVMTSHEFLEMIIDPWGNSRLQGIRPAISGLSNPVIPVEYLLEICDPCVSPHDAYPIGSVWVSDFVTPDYYQPQAGSTQFSYAQRIQGPGEVSVYGYVTWYQPGLGRWFQKKAGFDGKVEVFDIGTPDMSKLPARAVIDQSMDPFDFDESILATPEKLAICEQHEAATKTAGELLLKEVDHCLSCKGRTKRIKKKLIEK